MERTTRLIPPLRLWRLTSWLLSHASGRAYRLIVDRAGGAWVRTHFGLLAALAEFGPLSQAEIARRLGVDPKDIAEVLNQLEAEGLARRTRDERDRRRNAIAITAKGRRALQRLERRLGEVHEELLAPLSAEERRQLNDLLQRLIAHHLGEPLESESKRRADTGS